MLAEIAAVAAAETVDLTVVAGDLFDSGAPGAESERIVYEALLDLAAVSPVVVVGGNHDHPRRLQAVTPLLELGRISVGAMLARPDEGGVLRMTIDSGETARIALVPFVSRRGIVTADHLMGLDADKHGGVYAERLALVLAALTQGLSTEEVNLVVAHLMVHGGMLGGGERAAHTIFDYAIPAQAFDGALSYVALGHLHRQHRIPASAPVWYSGSPLQLDFGEHEDRKGVLVVEATPGLPASLRPIPLLAGRRLVVLRGSLEEVVTAAEGLEEDAYLKVELEERARVGLADEVRSILPNAVEVALAAAEDAGVAEPPERLGRPPHELFVEYLEERSVSDERLVSLFAELLAEAHEAETT